MRRKDLLKLPEREWSNTSVYSAIMVINTGFKQNGYAQMAIIGINAEGQPFEIAGYCDDIAWEFPSKAEYGFRNDMYYPSGILRYWSNKFNFKVGMSLSTILIELIPRG
jgi:hypothetical protein